MTKTLPHKLNTFGHAYNHYKLTEYLLLWSLEWQSYLWQITLRSPWNYCCPSYWAVSTSLLCPTDVITDVHLLFPLLRTKHHSYKTTVYFTAKVKGKCCPLINIFIWFWCSSASWNTGLLGEGYSSCAASGGVPGLMFLFGKQASASNWVQTAPQ